LAACATRARAGAIRCGARRTPPLAGGAARFTVERLSVVESTLSPKGSTYAVRAEAALRRAGRH